jgi:predicted small lipoprotein YifL
LARLAPVLAALGVLAACGQKGPLYLPSASPAGTNAAGRLPGAPGDAMPHGPATPPPLSASSPPSTPSPAQ